MHSKFWRPLVCLSLTAVLLVLLTVTACVRGGSQVYGWHALETGMELSSEEGAGPQGQRVLGLLYTIVAGQDYAIERRMPVEGLQGQPSLRLMAKATRVLHLAVVLVDDKGREHECARTLLPGDWRELNYNAFQLPVHDWAQIVSIRFVDRTGGLGGQGPVSLKLVGLPLQE